MQQSEAQRLVQRGLKRQNDSCVEAVALVVDQGIKIGQTYNGGSTPLPTQMIRGIYVGTSGSVTVATALTGKKVTFANLAAGIIHPIACQTVFGALAETSATGVVACW